MVGVMLGGWDFVTEDCGMYEAESEIKGRYIRHRLTYITLIFTYMKDNIYIGKEVLVMSE